MKKLFLTLSLFIAWITITLAQNDCTQPEITATIGAGVYCPDEEVILSVTGDLNDAEEWTWYEGRCGGQAIATGTDLTVSVTETVSYFVRGTGGCVGNSASCFEIIVRLDDIGPEIVTASEDITVDNEPGTCQAIVEFETPTGEDNCSEEITVIQVAGPESGSSFPVGTTEVSFELADGLDNISTHNFTVTVIDSELPTIECLENIDVENDPGECGAIVTYNAPIGSDNCPGAVTELTEGLGSGAFFPVGTTIETYTVIDASGNSSTCSFEVTVRDTEPPVITLFDKPITIWPPNHKHHEFAIADQIKEVSDNCGGVTIEDVVIDEVSSDEPQNDRGDGNTDSDIVIADDCRNMLLLAERAGVGNGRVYTVHVALKDLHGNIGTASYTATVPHDRGKKTTTIDDGPQYTVNGCDLEETDQNNERNSSTRVEVGVETYPNPFRGNVEVKFTPRFSDQVKIELFSMNGLKVADLMQTEVKAGIEYQWNFDLSSLDKNIYIIVIWGDKTYGMKRINK